MSNLERHHYILIFSIVTLIASVSPFVAGCGGGAASGGAADTTTTSTAGGGGGATTTSTTNTTTTTVGSPRIVAVGDALTTITILYSDDYGATWSSYYTEAYLYTDLNCVVYDSVSGRYYAAGDDGEILSSSSGSASWSSTSGTQDSDDEFYGIASDGAGKLVSVGTSYYTWDGGYYFGPVRYRNLSGSSYYNYLVHSNDELAGNSLNSGYLYGVAVDGNSKFVAVGKRILSSPTETISVARYSTDGGANWTEHNSNATISLGASVQLRDVAATQANTFYAVGDSGTVMMTSNGGTSWTSVSIPAASGYTLYAIASDSPSAAATMVIAGSSGLVIRGTKSGDTWSWASVSSGTSQHLMDVSTDRNGNWVAVGSSGKVIYSRDNAASWSSGSSGTSKELYGVTFGD